MYERSVKLKFRSLADSASSTICRTEVMSGDIHYEDYKIPFIKNAS
jgi:hypothetical protein